MQVLAGRTAQRAASSSQQRRPAFGNAKVARQVVLRAADTEVSNGALATHTPLSVNFDELSSIIKMVHDTDIIELELKSKKFTLNVRKKEALQQELPTIQYAAAPQSYAPPPPAPAPAPAAAPAAPAPSAAPTPAPAPIARSATKIDGLEITSPMAGTFYGAAAPGEAPFVKAGDRVKKGQVVGIIEAMKLMNEIEAEIGGEVVKVLVDNGTPVTPGMPLILIRP